MSLWSKIQSSPPARWLTVVYSPSPNDRAFIDTAQTQQKEGLEVTVAVLDASQSRRYFGVPMARRGIQPIWLRIANQTDTPCRLHVVSIDPNYFSPHEAASANHFSTAKRLLGFGALGWLLLPLLLFLPLKLIIAWKANKKMDALFRDQAFRLRPIAPGRKSEGFIFAPLDAGNKVMHVRILRWEGPVEFDFSVPVAGLDADYRYKDFTEQHAKDQLIECDLPALRDRLLALPRAVSSSKRTKEGDPVNLIVIGDFPTVLSAFGARWDETETITLATCWKTFRSFMIGTEYRYSPVSALYLFGRSQDFALQRVRESINERLHLRLWITELRFEGKPVWVGQISRDIGVRFTPKTWNLTTHRIDPDVDESRDYVLEDLIAAERLEKMGYVDGVGECEVASPRHNLTGDPYYTDGKRAVAVVSTQRTAASFIARL
jgi:hypothetical protein